MDLKRILTALLAACLLWSGALAETFDGFSLELPELKEAEYAEKADGAFLFSGAADLGGSAPVILACQWLAEPAEETPETALAAIDEEARNQGFAVNESELLRAETLDGGQLVLARQSLSMRVGFGALQTEVYTGRVAYAREGDGAYVFSVSSTEQATAEAALELFLGVEWAQ